MRYPPSDSGSKSIRVRRIRLWAHSEFVLHALFVAAVTTPPHRNKTTTGNPQTPPTSQHTSQHHAGISQTNTVVYSDRRCTEPPTPQDSITTPFSTAQRPAQEHLRHLHPEASFAPFVPFVPSEKTASPEAASYRRRRHGFNFTLDVYW